MKRLGYTSYAAQGGDWGAIVVDLMGLQAPLGLLGIHTNMPGIFPAAIDGAAFSRRACAVRAYSDDEKVAYERLQFVYQKGIAYGFQMGLRPQTLYGIADSPVGLAAYFLDHDARSYELITRVFQGQARGPHARRHPRQHHDRLVDEHGAIRRPSLLGILGQRGISTPRASPFRLPSASSLTSSIQPREVGRSRRIPN